MSDPTGSQEGTPPPQVEPTMREKYPALDFLMKHVDNIPNMSHTRFPEELRQRGSDTAIGLALAGEVGAATRIIELMRIHGIDPFNSRCDESIYVRPAMYFAWEATDSWPGWIPPEERTQNRLDEIEAEARKIWLERFTEEWSVDEETADKALEMARVSINNVFPDVPMFARVDLAQQWFKEGRYGYATNPMGPFSIRYYKFQSWWRRGLYPFPWQQVFRSAGLTIVLDIQLKLALGGDDKARTTFDDICKSTFYDICERITFTEGLEMLACSRSAWQAGLFAPDKTSGDGSLFVKLLELSQTDVHAGAQRAVHQLEKRLESGPERPFRQKTVAELAQLISAHTFQNCDFLELEMYGSPIRRPNDENDLLHEPCPEEEVADLKRRLGIDLPQDYLDFLAATNGLEPFWDGAFRVRLLAPAQKVTTVSLSYPDGIVSLLPGDHAGIEWPTMPAQAVSLSGGEEHDYDGDLWLIDRDTTARCKEAVFAALAASDSDGDNKRKIQGAIEELYGDVQRFRELEFGLLESRHWDAEFTVPYNGVRGLLETMAERSMHVYRQWEHCFRPSFRKFKNQPPFVL